LASAETSANPRAVRRNRCGRRAKASVYLGRRVRSQGTSGSYSRFGPQGGVSLAGTSSVRGPN